VCRRCLFLLFLFLFLLLCDEENIGSVVTAKTFTNRNIFNDDDDGRKRKKRSTTTTKMSRVRTKRISLRVPEM